MKLLTEEEISAHRYHTLSGGIKGMMGGLAISAFIFKVVPMRFPRFNPMNFSYSIRTAILISPPTLLASICAEEASNHFDRLMYGANADPNTLAEAKRWAELPLGDKLLESGLNNKYKIIGSLWAASMYGSWRLVDRDPIMTKVQKAVQARMYAQALTVVMLLASVMLSMYGAKRNPENKEQRRQRQWELLLDQAANEEREFENSRRLSNEERVKGKIYRYD